MRKHTFTIFWKTDRVHSYLFNVTRAEAEKIVEEMNKTNNEGQEKYYYMEGYFE